MAPHSSSLSLSLVVKEKKEKSSWLVVVTEAVNTPSVSVGSIFTPMFEPQSLPFIWPRM